jgi:hypothetical protein
MYTHPTPLLCAPPPVGKDQRAQAFLATLDTHPTVGGSIDCTSYYELESAEYQRRGINLSPSMWLVKMMVRLSRDMLTGVCAVSVCLTAFRGQGGISCCGDVTPLWAVVLC